MTTLKNNFVLLAQKDSKIIAICSIALTLFLYFPAITNIIHPENNRYWLMLFKQMNHPLTPLNVTDPMDHFAKVGLRLIVPLIGYFTPFSGIQGKFAMLLIVKIIMGYFFYKKLFEFLDSKINNRVTALIVTLGISISYIGSTFVSDYQNFDDFGYFFILLFLTSNSKSTIYFSAILAAFSDERTILPLIIIALYKFPKINFFNCYNYSILLAIGSRFFVGFIFQLFPSIQNGGVILFDYVFHGNINYLFIGLYSAFKSFWLIILLYIYINQNFNLRNIGIVISMLGILIISVSVWDLTRSLCYGFPLLIISIIEIHKKFNSQTIMKLLGVMLMVNMISPDYSVCDNIFCSQNFIIKSLVNILNINTLY
jgi:hypothetical protein